MWKEKKLDEVLVLQQMMSMQDFFMMGQIQFIHEVTHHSYILVIAPLFFLSSFL